MKTFASFICLLGICFYLPAQTPACGLANKQALKMWSSFSGFSFSLKYEQWVAKANTAVAKYNAAMGNKNNTHGPDRSLKFGGIAVRTITPGKVHTYVTVPSLEKELSFTFNKLDGDARVGITVCTSTRTGSPVEAYTEIFEAGGSNTATRSITLSNTKGKIVRWVIKNYSGSGTFEYRIAHNTEFPQSPPPSVAKGPASKMWNAYGSWKPIPSSVWKQKANQAVQQFNNTVGNGDQNMSFNFGQILNEDIKAQEFQTITLPPAYRNSVAFSFIKYGRGEAGITICTTSAKGSPKYAHHYFFGEDDTNTTRSFPIENTRGKVITILIRNYSKSRSFDYRLSE